MFTNRSQVLKNSILALILLMSLTGVQPASAGVGATSGGGGYVTDNSLKLLRSVTAHLAADVRQASPVIFSQVLPANFSQAQLADAIQNIRIEPDQDNKRDGRDLIFDYGVDQKGPYLKALRSYFWLYGSTAIKFNSPDETAKIAADLRVKLLHEAAHLLNIGTSEATDSEADLFAFGAMRAMARDSFSCDYVDKPTSPKSILSKGLQDVNLQTISSWGYSDKFALLFHRAFPRLAFTQNSSSDRSYLKTAKTLFATNFLTQLAGVTDSELEGTDADHARSRGMSVSIEPQFDSEGNRTIEIPMKATVEHTSVDVLYHLKISERTSEILEAYVDAPSLVQKRMVHTGISKFINSDYNYWTMSSRIQVPLSCVSYAAPLKMEAGDEDLNGQQEVDLKEFARQSREERRRAHEASEDESRHDRWVIKQIENRR